MSAFCLLNFKIDDMRKILVLCHKNNILARLAVIGILLLDSCRGSRSIANN